ncbi:MAG: hypothetical protein IPF78_11365 [Flavobacteriales bacterium]|nr:hypothetical protein [Flavobacteriales bacterium]
MYKQKYPEDGRAVKQRSKDNYNLLPYRGGPCTDVYGPLNLFAEYPPTPMFEEETAPN